jgi:excisionase family DNA binding protein
MNVKDAARELGVSISMIYKLMGNKELAYVQVGRRKMPTEDGVRAYKEGHTVEAEPEEERQPAKPSKQFMHLFR